MEHILKLALTQGTATVGAVMRAWLWAMGVPAVLSFMMMYQDLKPVYGAIEAVSRALPACLIIGVLFSIPVMVVLAIIHIARKW